MAGHGASRDVRATSTLVPGDGNTLLLPVDKAFNAYANDYYYYDSGGSRQSVRDQIAAGGGGGGVTNVTAATTFLAAGNIPYATNSGVRSVKDKNTLNFNDATNTLSVNNISSGSITNSGTIATTDLNATGTVTTNTLDAQTVNATNAVISNTGTFTNLNVTNLNTVVQSAGTTSAPNYSLVVASGPSTGKIKLLTAGTNITMTETDATHVSIAAASGSSSTATLELSNSASNNIKWWDGSGTMYDPLTTGSGSTGFYYKPVTFDTVNVNTGTYTLAASNSTITVPTTGTYQINFIGYQQYMLLPTGSASDLSWVYITRNQTTPIPTGPVPVSETVSTPFVACASNYYLGTKTQPTYDKPYEISCTTRLTTGDILRLFVGGETALQTRALSWSTLCIRYLHA